MARQPNQPLITPPIAGAIAGVIVIAIITAARRRTASSPLLLSRTIARPRTRAPHAPNDCSRRAPISAPTLATGIASTSPNT